MNRWLTQFRYSFNKVPVDLNFQLAIGASGAPTLNAANSKGILSVVRNSAGRYTFTLKETSFRFLGFQSSSQNSTGISAAPGYGMVSVGVNSSPATVVIQYHTGGVATDPGNGETLYGVIKLEDSSAP